MTVFTLWRESLEKSPLQNRKDPLVQITALNAALDTLVGSADLALPLAA